MQGSLLLIIIITITVITICIFKNMYGCSDSPPIFVSESR